MAYQGKTDWTYGDIVTEQDMNRIEQGVQGVSDELDKAEAKSLTLALGVQTVTVDRDTPLNVTSIRGRTLVNLLGRDGDFESGLERWDAFAAEILDDPYFGNRSVKLGNGIGTDARVSSRHQILVAMCKSAGSWDIDVQLFNRSGILIETNWSTNSEWQYRYLAVDNGESILSLVLESRYSPDVLVDGVAVYDITEAEYNAIDSMTPEEIAVAYPYVDSLQNVNGVYIQNTGGNLLPTDIYSWAQGTLSASTGSEAENTFRLRSVFVDVFPNTQYTVSVATGDIGVFQYTDTDFVTSVTLSPSQVAFTTSANTTRVRFILRIDNSTVLTQNDLSRFSPMLVIGSEAKPFEPQRTSYLYLPSCQLASNVDGSITDRMYTDNEGKPRVIRQFRRMELDGSLGWRFANIFTGIKEVAIDLPTPEGENAVIAKFDGKLLKAKPDGVPPAGGDEYTITSSTYLFISIANFDSGWGPNYRPTDDEIKAYFYGWRMYAANTGNATIPYNGESGQTKGWVEWWSAGNPTTTVPMVQSPNYTPYLLQYQLANPVDEPLEYEGSLMLYEGANQIKVGMGIVVREKANPFINSAGNAYFNADPHSKFKYRTSSLLSMYRNSDTDELARISTTEAYGRERYVILASNYDPSAVYQVTYLALDTYKLGIAPTSINSEYAPNLLGTIDDLVQGNKDALTRISVVESQMAIKDQPQWITATLLNGWKSAFGRTVQYMKDAFGFVHLRGTLDSSEANKAIGTNIFLLPVQYRPERVIGLPTVTYNNVQDVKPYTVDVNHFGHVRVTVENTGRYFYLESVSFYVGGDTQ